MLVMFFYTSFAIKTKKKKRKFRRIKIFVKQHFREKKRQTEEQNYFGAEKMVSKIL